MTTDPDDAPSPSPRSAPSGKGKPRPSKSDGKKPGVRIAGITLPPDLAWPILGGAVLVLALVGYVVVSAVLFPAPKKRGKPAHPVTAEAPVAPKPVKAEPVDPNPPLDKQDAALPLINYAQEGVKPLKRNVLMTREQFEAQSDLYELGELEGNPYLAYRVRLPKSWTQVTDDTLKQMQLSNRILGVVDYFVSPADLQLRSSFRIKAQKVQHMLRASDWLYQYAITNKLTFQGLSRIDDRRAEAMYVTTEDDISYVVRMAVIVNGQNVVIAEYFLPVDKYDEQKELQIWAVTSFYLQYRDESPGEVINDLNFFDIATVGFPASWRMQDSNIKSLNEMDASIVNMKIDQYGVESRLQGRIDVFLFAANDQYAPEKAFVKINKNNMPYGLAIKDAVARFEVPINKHGLQLMRTTAYRINDAKESYQDYQFWVTILKGKNYYYYICMLNLPRNYDTYNWVRNVTAYQYIVENIREGN